MIKKINEKYMSRMIDSQLYIYIYKFANRTNNAAIYYIGRAKTNYIIYVALHIDNKYIQANALYKSRYTYTVTY